MAVLGLIIIAVIIAVLIAIVALVLYFILYKRNLNRKLKKMNEETEKRNKEYLEDQNESEKKSRRKIETDFYEEPERKRMPTLNTVALVVVVATCVFCVIFCIITVNSQVSNLYTSIQNIEGEIGALNARLDSLSTDSEPASSDCAILSANIEYGAFHKEDHTADVTIELQPEKISPNTKISCTYYGIPVEMEENENGILSGTLRLDVFRKLDEMETITYTVQTEDGKKETTTWDEDSFFPVLYNRYLMNIGMQWNDHSSFNGKKAKINVKGTITAEPEDGCEDWLKEVNFVVCMNDKEIDRKELGELKNSPENTLDFKWKKSYKKQKEEDNVAVYLESIDSYGYKMVHCLHTEGEETEVFSLRIYDENGKLVYEE